MELCYAVEMDRQVTASSAEAHNDILPLFVWEQLRFLAWNRDLTDAAQRAEFRSEVDRFLAVMRPECVRGWVEKLSADGLDRGPVHDRRFIADTFIAIEIVSGLSTRGAHM